MAPPVAKAYTLTLSLLQRTGDRVWEVLDEIEGGRVLRQEEKKNPACLGAVRGEVIWELRGDTQE